MKCMDQMDTKGFQGCPCMSMESRKPSVLRILFALVVVTALVWAVVTWPWVLTWILTAGISLMLFMMLSGLCGVMASRCMARFRGGKDAAAPEQA